MDLNQIIDRKHFNYEKGEEQAIQLEERIFKVPGILKSYLPKRQYGEQYKGNQLGITASSLIALGTIATNSKRQTALIALQTWSNAPID